MSTGNLQIDPDQIAKIIAQGLINNPTFCSNITASVAAQMTNTADANLKKVVQEAVDAATLRITQNVAAAEKRVTTDVEPTLRKRFDERLKVASSAFTDDWLQKQASYVLKNLIYEKFGRRAHQLADLYLGSHARKLGMLQDEDLP